MNVIFAILLAAKAQAKTFDACGVRFAYPSAWFARANPGDVIDSSLFPKETVRCAIGLRPPGWIQRNDASFIDRGNWAVMIVLVGSPFEAAARSGGFIPADRLADADGLLPSTVKAGGWAILVRQGVDSALHFHTACCEALRGKSWSHDRGRKGEIETVTSEKAVLSRGRHSAVIEAVDEDECSDVLTQIINSFHFVP